MLKIQGVKKTFNAGSIDEKKAVNGISLDIQTGDFVTVIGSNGAGKSTLLNLIAGTFIPDEGDIYIDETQLTRMPEYGRSRYISRIFQDPLMGTAASMTIEENLGLADLRGRKRGLRWGVARSRRQKYRQMLEKMGLGLENRLKQPVSLLSGGQRQSLTLIMATLNPPDLLLLDEHTAALDPKTAARVMALTEEIINENNLTAIMVTHNMQQAIRYGNRMIMLHEGQVRFDVRGEEKAALSVEQLVRRFGGTLKDETLLA